MDWTILSVFLAGVGLNYMVLRGIKEDLKSQTTQLDEKIFFLATGRKLEDVILEKKKVK